MRSTNPQHEHAVLGLLWDIGTAVPRPDEPPARLPAVPAIEPDAEPLRADRRVATHPPAVKARRFY